MLRPVTMADFYEFIGPKNVHGRIVGAWDEERGYRQEMYENPYGSNERLVAVRYSGNGCGENVEYFLNLENNQCPS